MHRNELTIMQEHTLLLETTKVNDSGRDRLRPIKEVMGGKRAN